MIARRRPARRALTVLDDDWLISDSRAFRRDYASCCCHRLWRSWKPPGSMKETTSPSTRMRLCVQGCWNRRTRARRTSLRQTHRATERETIAREVSDDGAARQMALRARSPAACRTA
eukprot:2475520-Pyramimonas_sp.AAC.1